MIGFFDAARDRLRSLAPALLQVETATDATAALETMALSQLVTALVHPLSDQAAPVGEAALLVSQLEVWTFGVTLALVYPGGFPEFELARDQVKAALRGWNWESQLATPVEYAGGQVLQYQLGVDGGRWLHLLRFRCSILESYEQLQP